MPRKPDRRSPRYEELPDCFGKYSREDEECGNCFVFESCIIYKAVDK